MRVHWLQHAEHEDLAAIQPWLSAHGHETRGTCLHAGDALPSTDAFDALIVMGSPMNIYDHALHPWLVPEKQLIRRALDGGKRGLGICLGAQLVADQLGGPVTRNRDPEIGWHPVTLTAAGRESPFFRKMPESFPVLHWHGDTFVLPPGALHLAISEACDQQAFSFDQGRVLGLQFHPEATQPMLHQWVRHETTVQSRYVQDRSFILSRCLELGNGNSVLLDHLLERFFDDPARSSHH